MDTPWAGAVLYAKDMDRVAAFYAAALGMVEEPPVRRADAAVKPWLFRGRHVWDGLDPEGNVIQFRTPAA